MKFKDFLQETGILGQSILSPHRAEKRMHTPVRNKGTTVSRMMSAGKVKSPSRPVGIISPTKPMTIPSVLGKAS